MSKLSERCEARKQEAEALADKYNSVKAEIEKLQQENNQRYQQFIAKNAQYAELTEQIREEEGVATESEVIELN